METAVADARLRQQMHAVGVDLPNAGDVTPAAVSRLISNGLRDDVPALKAKTQSLD